MFQGISCQSSCGGALQERPLCANLDTSPITVDTPVEEGHRDVIWSLSVDDSTWPFGFAGICPPGICERGREHGSMAHRSLRDCDRCGAHGCYITADMCTNPGCVSASAELHGSFHSLSFNFQILVRVPSKGELLQGDFLFRGFLMWIDLRTSSSA